MPAGDLSRRSFLEGLATASLLAPALSCGSKSSRLSPTAPSPTTPTTALPLGQQAQAAGYLYGAAVDVAGISDAGFASAVATECSLITSENSLKWAALRPAADRFDFTRGDTLLNFARARGLAFRGHTLVWHSSLPSWFSSTVNAGNAEQYLVDHITTVVRHYAGSMHSWDVVNEAVDPASGRADGLRSTPWLQMLGPRYLDLAFATAAAADADALLCYNEYGLEMTWSGARRDATLRLLSDLRGRGIPVHALGVQGHVGGTGWPQFDAAGFSAFLRSVGSLGLHIHITELDVKDNNLPANISARDQAVASIYRDYLAVALADPAVTAVITWGLSDKYTWIATSAPRTDGLAVRPLPLDSSFARKLAWDAMAAAFSRSLSAPAGKVVDGPEAPEPIVSAAGPKSPPPPQRGQAGRAGLLGSRDSEAAARPDRRRLP